jgi:hypothetical protein
MESREKFWKGLGVTSEIYEDPKCKEIEWFFNKLLVGFTRISKNGQVESNCNWWIDPNLDDIIRLELLIDIWDKARKGNKNLSINQWKKWYYHTTDIREHIINGICELKSIQI